MSEDDKPVSEDAEAGERALRPEARRALEEAAARRAKSKPEARPRELGGRDGPDPTRFGDWEKKGLISDF